jgi:copper transport protein
MTDAPRRAAHRVLAVGAIALALVVLVASPASAHAELLQSDPGPGAVLARPPDHVTLRFSEDVSISSGAVRVYDSSGDRVDAGGAGASGRTVTLPVSGLGNGAYAVTWRVTSADSHPVEGAFTFQVGQGGAAATSSDVQGLANRLLAEQGGDRVVGVLSGVARFTVFAGLALLIGAMFFAVVIWPSARSSSRAWRVVQVGWWTVTAGTLAGLVLYGPYAEGLGLGNVFSPGLIGDTLAIRFGQVWLARLILLVLMAPMLVMVFRRDRATGHPRRIPVWWPPVMLVLTVALVATPGLAGHAVTGEWTSAAIVADILHVLAMALWLGGLVTLAVVTLTRDATIAARDAVERFSRVAFACIVVLLATGAFQAWRQVGSLDALRTTDYGRILVVKIVLVALVIVFAAFSREVVLRMLPPAPTERGSRVPVVTGGSDDDPPGSLGSDDEIDEQLELRRLRRSVWAEIVTAMLILVATSLLVNAAPAKLANASGGQNGIAGVTLSNSKVKLDVSVTPAVAGENDVHVNVSDPNGAPKDVQDLTVTMALPDRGIAPIDVPLRRLGPGHYYSPGFQLLFGGDWRVTAKPLLSEFEQPTLRGSISIG